MNDKESDSKQEEKKNKKREAGKNERTSSCNGGVLWEETDPAHRVFGLFFPGLVGWVLWHINLCKLFYTKSIFKQIISYISNNPV